MSEGFRRFFMFVEGETDKYFVREVLEEILKASFRLDYIDIITWAQVPKKKRKEFINSLKKMQAQYLVLIDQDTGCVSGRKAKQLERHPYLDKNQIVVVRREIEAWYVAGGSSDLLRRLGFKRNFEEINKHLFQEAASAAHLDEVGTRIDLLKNYDFKLARSRNSSLAYLLKKITETSQND